MAVDVEEERRGRRVDDDATGWLEETHGKREYEMGKGETKVRTRQTPQRGPGLNFLKST